MNKILILVACLTMGVGCTQKEVTPDLCQNGYRWIDKKAKEEGGQYYKCFNFRDTEDRLDALEARQKEIMEVEGIVEWPEIVGNADKAKFEIKYLTKDPKKVEFVKLGCGKWLEGGIEYWRAVASGDKNVKRCEQLSKSIGL